MNISLSDEEIISRDAKKYGPYYELLMNKYLKIYPKIIATIQVELRQRYLSPEDYFYEFYESFEKAYRKYSEGKGKFYSYFKLIFYREVKRSVLKYINSKDGLDHSISLDEQIDEGIQLIDVIPNIQDDDPVTFSRISNARLMLKESLNDDNSPEDMIRYKAIILREIGLTYLEIAGKLNVTLAKVRSLLKIKNNEKLKNIYIELKLLDDKVNATKK